MRDAKQPLFVGRLEPAAARADGEMETRLLISLGAHRDHRDNAGLSAPDTAASLRCSIPDRRDFGPRNWPQAQWISYPACSGFPVG